MSRLCRYAVFQAVRLAACIAVVCFAASLMGPSATCFAGCGDYLVLYRGPHVQAARAALSGQMQAPQLLHARHDARGLSMPRCADGECGERTIPPQLPPSPALPAWRTHGDAVAPTPVAAVPPRPSRLQATALPTSIEEVELGGILRPPRGRRGTA